VTSLIGITKAKNEADFIEYFVRHNSLILDELYIAVESSSDNTAEIIDSLKQEGLVTELVLIHNREAHLLNLQGEAMTQIMRHAAARQKDSECYIFPLDADEIILEKREHVIEQLRVLAPNEYGLIKWKTFAPINGGLGTHDKIHEAFKPPTKEQSNIYKSVIPIQHARNSNIANGNHHIECITTHLQPRILDIELCHFPVRSAGQIISKALTSNHKVHLKNRAILGESYHLIAIAKKLRELNYNPSERDLTSLALDYYATSSDGEIAFNFNMIEAIPHIPRRYIPKKINPIRALDELLKDIIGRELND